jgi:type IV pilus assembly protein PilQ
MKNNFRLFVFIFLFSLFQFIPKTIAATTELPFPNPETTISLDFQDASLKTILKIFSIQSGLNFIASDAVQDKKMTLYFDKVPIKEAMDKLFKANNLYYELDKRSNIFIVKDWGKPEVDTITKVYRLKYQSVSAASILKEKSEVSQGASSGADLTATIKQRLSEYCKLSEDARTNSLIITDIPSRFKIIEQLIASLDVPQPQVMLEMEMLDVNKGTVDKLGVNWPATLAQLTVTGTKVVGFPFTGQSNEDWTIQPEAGVFGGPGSGWDFSTGWAGNRWGPNVLTVLGSTLSLDFLRGDSDTKTLARPKILTLNNETAEIKITTQKSLNAATTTNTDVATSTSGVERQEVGVTLRVTPQINPDTGEITMFISSKASDVTSSILSSSTKTSGSLTGNGTTVTTQTVFDPDERSTKSIVRVKDGDTIIIGGLIRHEFAQTINKVPILGDLPLIGSLFRHRDKSTDSQRELLIFISPHIIKEGKIELAKAKKIIIPRREQGVAVGNGARRRIIEASLNSFSTKK